MKTNLLKQGALIGSSAGIGTVTRKKAREFPIELVAINGRSAYGASKFDWEQAKRELTGNSETVPKEAIPGSAADSRRWDPIRGSSGHKVPVGSGEDEDEEGRSDNERLVDERIGEAEHDQRRQATRDDLAG